MFGKLLKNDLKAQWHFVSSIYLCAIIVAAVAEGFAMFSDKNTVVVLAGSLVILALAITSLITLIAVAIMFSDTVFGRAGYLTLTLPVKTGSLVASKTVSGLVWIFVSFGLFIGSIFLCAYQVRDEFAELEESADSILALLGIPSVFSIFVAVILTCITFAAAILLLVQCLYLAISLSHISFVGKFGRFGTIILFFVVFGVIYSVTSKIAGMSEVGIIVTDNAVKFTSNMAQSVGSSGLKIPLAGMLMNIAAGVALHFPITYIVKNKVNIK